MYLVNGDVADRGGHAVEIYLLLFGYMLACPGCVMVNRGNHESFDMNIRGFHEGGGFAAEVAKKYDPEMFALFQVSRAHHSFIWQPSDPPSPHPSP